MKGLSPSTSKLVDPTSDTNCIFSSPELGKVVKYGKVYSVIFFYVTGSK